MDSVLRTPDARHVFLCPAPYIHPQAGHFAQEWGDDIARRALQYFSNPS